jgi:saccharopine dehydrogenase (NAD+, L-lysine-forming)
MVHPFSTGARPGNVLDTGDTMNSKKLLILGGYGNTGRPLAELLLQETAVTLVIAGRDVKKAQALAATLNERFAGERVRGQSVDASDPAILLEAFSGLDMVVVASSTADYTEQVAGAALEGGIDYFDVLFSTQKYALLQAMAPQIEEAGLCFITDGGFHPGLPAALIRRLAQGFDRLEMARVGSVIKIDWTALDLSPATMDEFVGEFMDFQTLVYRDGQWRKSSALAMMKPIYIDFTSEIGPNFGRQYCIPMFLEEMRVIPELYPEIKETGFLVGGFNWFVDWFLSPIIMVSLKLYPQRAIRPMGRLMLWGLRRFGKPPYGTLLKAEVQGQKGAQILTAETILYHEDGYAFTAIPAAACLLQYLDGSIRRPGLWLQANAVEPGRMMIDMERMGIQIQYRETRGL